MLTNLATKTAEEIQPLQKVTIQGESFYRISDVQKMRPFLMSIVSNSDHWMFISGNGGLTAGRKNADYALFPYYTDDKIAGSAEHTGCKTIVKVWSNDPFALWEPFSVRSENNYDFSRNIYKNMYGNKVIFEEVNHDLQLSFQYEWNASDRFGFLRKSTITNTGSNNRRLEVLDGLQNILPYGVGKDLQSASSNLADAYKRTELVADSGLAIFALSAIIVDKAEPSEALSANIVWGTGMEQPVYLLSSLQLDAFRKNTPLQQEEDIKGEKASFFMVSTITLEPDAAKSWSLVAEVNKDHATIIKLAEVLKQNDLILQEVGADVDSGTRQLMDLVSSSDGFQQTADKLQDGRHYANSLFNIMRGGIFDDDYMVEGWDFSRYLQNANVSVFEASSTFLADLGAKFSWFRLKETALQSGNPDLIRLSLEYMPLKFSRRHGDPSRPWNQFSINMRNEEDGSKVLDYQGNWRDIFQNWEALAYSYPGFTEAMIRKFLNSSTFDGYNPYRITKDGFDWETIEPDDPWSYIGYWGDHQVIYLLKLLEHLEDVQPGFLLKILNEKQFVYANVPYRIKPYHEIVKDPKNTIGLDGKLEHKIHERKKSFGADGALLTNAKNEICRVTFTEKILAQLLAKLTNFIPEAGIWMNTQRPEWNDANNALVGNGVSMVTLCYMRRMLQFLKPLWQQQGTANLEVATEIKTLFTLVHKALQQGSQYLAAPISDKDRRTIMDSLGTAAGQFRDQVYNQHFSGETESLPGKDLVDFTETVIPFLDHAIQANKRADGMYHSYNLISFSSESATVGHLDEMLEGLVAVLSSGFLSAAEAVELLDALRGSRLYRQDQQSYLLYPDKDLPGFLAKNHLEASSTEAIALLRQLVEDGNQSIVSKDVHGHYHFNGKFRNAADLTAALQKLEKSYDSLLLQDKQAVLQLFEDIFNHKSFTGRSGTFFAYEGLGSIYWHMVSKLLLAVNEIATAAAGSGLPDGLWKKLINHYYEIKEGIGVHKSPVNYGAFPTDPYSHSPKGKGVQQPGMTGQVKEDILSRWGELGVSWNKGQLQFRPAFLQPDEFLKQESVFSYTDLSANNREETIPAKALVFTCCQVPVIYKLSDKNNIKVTYSNGNTHTLEGNMLDKENSEKLQQRTGEVMKIQVNLQANSGMHS